MKAFNKKKRALSLESLLNERNTAKIKEDNTRFRHLLQRIADKNENLSKENNKLNINLSSLVKLLKDKDSKLKIINKNQELMNRYSNLNSLRVKVYSYLKNLILTIRDKDQILLKFYFLFWRKLSKDHTHQNLARQNANFFTIRNDWGLQKIKKFETEKLKISRFLDDIYKQTSAHQSFYLSFLCKRKFINDAHVNSDPIGLIPILHQEKYFSMIIMKIFELATLKAKFIFLKNLKLLNLNKRTTIVIRQQPSNTNNLSLSNISIEGKLNVPNKSEPAYKRLTLQNKTLTPRNALQGLEISGTNEVHEKYLNTSNNDNLLDYIKDNREKPDNSLLNQSFNHVMLKHDESTKKFSLQKLIYIIQSMKKLFEINTKFYFWINIVKMTSEAKLNQRSMTYVNLCQISKFNKLKFLIKKQQTKSMRNSFKLFLRKTFKIKEIEEKEELEFFQNTNYSLILLNLLERIFIKNYNTSEFKTKFFLKLKLINSNRNYIELSHKINNIDIFNNVTQISNKKSFILHKILYCKLQKKTQNNLLKRIFILWKNVQLNSIIKEQKSILDSLPNLEDEFTEKINHIENAYKTFIEKMSLDEDRKIKEKNDEINNLREEIKSLIQNNKELKILYENGLISNQNNFEKKIKEYENLKYVMEERCKNFDQENTKLLEKLTFYKEQCVKFEEEKEIYIKKISELEEKSQKLNIELENLRILYSEKNAKFENMKSISNESTQELIKTNNELMKLKSENKTLSDKLENISEYIEKLTNDISLKDKAIKQLRLNEEGLNQQINSEKEKIQNKFLYEKTSLLDKIDYLEKEANTNIEQIRSLTKENKMLTDKLRFCSDYGVIKNDYLVLKEKFMKYEEENIYLKNQNTNLQKQTENLIQNLALETKKGDQARIELEDLREMTKESKEDLKKALDEMEGYAHLLSAFEEKIREAEDAKLNAERERDNAINDVKEIRQRYIKILGSNKGFEI